MGQLPRWRRDTAKADVFPLYKKTRLNNWHDTFKELPKEEVDMGFVPKDYLFECLQEQIQKRIVEKLCPIKN